MSAQEKGARRRARHNGFNDWETPKALFDKLHAEFGFDLDVCATDETAKCSVYFTPEEDALKQDWYRWGKAAWMNPPYGRTIGEWMAKATKEVARGMVVVALIPVRTDTAWWHDFVEGKTEVRFIRGRLRFVGASAVAPFPSAVVVFR